MATDNKTEIENLQDSLMQTVDTFQSANELLDLNKELLKGDKLLPEKVKNIKKLQREFLLDSFRVNRFHKGYKEWENKDKDAFIENEIKGYNNKLGQMSRLNFETEKLDKEYEGLRETVKLPTCRLSIQAIKLYDDSKLLQYIGRNTNGEYPSSVDITGLFSLEPNSNLPPPDFKVFNRLINIEYKLRIQRKVKYEVLLSVKQQLTAKNKKWSLRDSELNYFMTRKLVDIMNEVEKVRKSEYEDLKDYDYDNNEEEEEEMREQDFENEESVNENEHENVEDDDDDSLNGNEHENLHADNDVDDDEEKEVFQNQPEIQEEQPSDSASSTEAEINIANEKSAGILEEAPATDDEDNVQSAGILEEAPVIDDEDDVMNIDT